MVSSFCKIKDVRRDKTVAKGSKLFMEKIISDGSFVLGVLNTELPDTKVRKEC